MPLVDRAIGNRNERGITPTIVYSAPLNFTVCPTMSFFAPNCEVQRAWLIKITFEPVFSSSGRNPRPSSGRTPSAGSKSHDTTSESTLTGLSSPFSVNPVS